MISIHVSKFDKKAISAVSRIPSSFRPFFELMSFIGHPVTTSFIGIMVVAYGIMSHKPALAFSGTSVWLTLIISTILKHLVERARPLTEYVAAMRIPSFSFPSGHTAGSTAGFGLLAYVACYALPHPFHYLGLLFAALVILVGLSRVYLGAHYPTDVIGGWLLGGVAVGIVMFVVKPLA